MRYIPLLVIPFVLYNVFAFLIFENFDADFREATMFTVTLVSGAPFSLTVSGAILLLAVLLLAVEVVKATRIGSSTIADQVLATALFVITLLEFLLVPQAATSTFFLLLVIAVVDLICGFAISLKSATRDINLNG